MLDADGAEVGRVLQTGKAKRSIQHALWLQQPDRPNVVARYHWAVGSSGDVADRAGTAAVAAVADAAFDLALSVVTFGLGDGDGESSESGEARPTTWRAGSEVVLTHGDAVGHRARYTRQAGWLDMRLAFALAAVRGR
ncbi:hypothetical protein [Streptomyces sp. CA-111067]|uniref:hypothetical protein n=1 Tax=Streptomyces sp. CA-111067 TaxID=3240046 RepID=UPI003D95294B